MQDGKEEGRTEQKKQKITGYRRRGQEMTNRREKDKRRGEKR